MLAASGNRWCAYYDPFCPSTSRWSTFAGDGLAGLCVDGEPPGSTGPQFTSFVAPPEGGISDPTTAVTYTLSNGMTTGCTIDGVPPPGGCGSPISLTGLGVGEHVLSITATDTLGRTTSVIRTWAVPPVANYQAADLVLGQDGDFTTNFPTLGGVSGKSLGLPLGITTNLDSMWIADSDNCRILGWSDIPTNSIQFATVALGQASPTVSDCPEQNPNAPTTASTVGAASGYLCATDSRLYFSDNESNRVLVWNLPLMQQNQAADLVLGQGSGPITPFTTKAFGDGEGALHGPDHLWCDDDRLILADTGNNRVVIWAVAPSANGEPPTVVLGWPEFGMGDPADQPPASPPTRASMNGPFGVHYDGQRLYVADYNNSRVLVWNALPNSSGVLPDFVLGQPDFESAAPGTGRDGLDHPRGIVTYKDALLVADRGNRRLVIWTPIPTTSGEKPRAVLGAPDIDTPALAGGNERSFFQGPRDLTVANAKLFVTDGNRVLRFQLRN